MTTQWLLGKPSGSLFRENPKYTAIYYNRPGRDFFLGSYLDSLSRRFFKREKYRLFTEEVAGEAFNLVAQGLQLALLQLVLEA
jgi:hypothetical protein